MLNKFTDSDLYEELDNDLYEDLDEPCTCAAFGSWSPSCPWNAPGMSPDDFIR